MATWADATAATGDDYGKAAPIGLAVIVVLGIVGYFLAKSMNRNLKKVPASFDPPPAQEEGGDGAGGVSGPSTEGPSDPMTGRPSDSVTGPARSDEVTSARPDPGVAPPGR